MKKKIIIISIGIIILIFVINLIMFGNQTRKGQDNDENNVNMKSQPQATSDATQLATEDKDMEMKERELDQKMKSILYGILNYTGEIEEEYNEEKVNEAVNEMDLTSGIYISERARDKILTLIKNATNLDYQVDEHGYLMSKENVEDEYAQELEKIITGNKNVIIDYNTYYYCILGNNICTFNIEENQYLQKFTSDDLTILILNLIKYEEEYESEKDLINQIINNAI